MNQADLAPTWPIPLHQMPVSQIKVGDMLKLSEVAFNLYPFVAGTISAARSPRQNANEIDDDGPPIEKLREGLARLTGLRGYDCLSFLNAFSRGPVPIGSTYFGTTAHEAIITIAETIDWKWADLSSSDSEGSGNSTGRHLEELATYLHQQGLLLAHKEVAYLRALMEIERDSALVLRFRIIPPEAGDLSFEEQMIVDTLKKSLRPMTGEELLVAAQLKPDSNHKKLLVSLCERVWIKSMGRKGYGLYHWT